MPIWRWCCRNQCRSPDALRSGKEESYFGGAKVATGLVRRGVWWACRRTCPDGDQIKIDQRLQVQTIDLMDLIRIVLRRRAMRSKNSDQIERENIFNETVCADVLSEADLQKMTGGSFMLTAADLVIKTLGEALSTASRKGWCSSRDKKRRRCWWAEKKKRRANSICLKMISLAWWLFWANLADFARANCWNGPDPSRGWRIVETNQKDSF